MECIKPTKSDIESLVSRWQRAEKFEDDGYGDLAFTIKQNCLQEAKQLPREDCKKLVDIIWPNS